jgi:putative PIG3 family NAD(P)H quinone oxidoreductase
MMRAATVDPSLGNGPDSLRRGHAERPTPGVGQVLIKVAAAGVNRADILQRQGTYPPPPGSSSTLGLECAGEVVEVGPEVNTAWRGRPVAALVDGGAYADYCVADANLVLDTDDRMSPIIAAALPEALATLWMIFFHLGGLTADKTVLVHGGTGGIGSTAIQVARWRGCRVIATAGTPAKRELLEQLGASASLDYRAANLAESVLAATNGRGVDAVLDNIGPSAIDRTVDLLAPYGQILTIGSQQGRIGEVNAGPLMSRQAAIRFASLRRTPAAVKAEIMAAVRRQLWPEVLVGGIRPLIASVHAMEAPAEAHRAMEAGLHSGKIVLAQPQIPFDGAHPLSPYLQTQGRHQ